MRVQVFYEALCPDSKQFIKAQVVPLMAKLVGSLELGLVPYGKAQASAVLVFTHTKNALLGEVRLNNL